MSLFSITADQLASFRNSVVTAAAGYESEHCYSGCVRKDFALGSFVLSQEIRNGLVLDANAAENKQLLLFTDQEEAEQAAQLLHQELQQLCIGPNCYVEAAPVNNTRETVQTVFIFTKKKVELTKMYMLHVFLSW